ARAARRATSGRRLALPAAGSLPQHRGGYPRTTAAPEEGEMMATEEIPRRQCHAVVLDDEGNATPCPTRAQPGHPYCSKHTGPLRMHKPTSTQEFLQEWGQTAQHVIERHLSKDKPAKGEHDPELVRALMPLALPIYSIYWRVETVGIENIPTEGPAMLTTNHSGTIPIDGDMLKLAVLKDHGRNPRLLAGDI